MEDVMEVVLNNREIRVLGSLIEKEMATPEYYPLSLNALINACNQKSNREPVVAYDEEDVLEAIEGLKEKKLSMQSNLSRVPKYEELLIKLRNYIHAEAAVMCVLMLRGPQTAGEIRGRSERLYAFENLEAANSTIESLISLGHVKRLPRQAGRKEVRYIHTLGAETDEVADTEPVPEKTDLTAITEYEERIQVLEDKVASLAGRLDDVTQMFESFKKQFE